MPRIIVRRRRPIILVASLCFLGVLVAGAASVTSELIARPQRREVALTEIRGLGAVLASETTASTAWESLLAAHPEWLVAACTVRIQPAQAR